MVQVAANMIIVDLTVRGLSPGTYFATVRQTGDILRGAESTGGVWERDDKDGNQLAKAGVWGTVSIDEKHGSGSLFLDKSIQIWELVGRSMVVSQKQSGFANDDQNTLVGVIARSAGVWENDKTVCSCSGKTVWEERKEQVGKGML